MKVYISHSREFDFINELYEPIRKSNLGRIHQFFLPHETSKEIKTKDIIQNSELMLAEVSYPSTGQGIELGWADVFNIPIICLVKNGYKLSGSLKYINNKNIYYTDSEDLIKKLTEILKG